MTQTRVKEHPLASQSVLSHPHEFAEPNGSHEAARPDLVQRVAARYRYIEPDAVTAFLNEQPDIAKILLAAVSPIESLFGRNTELSLQVLVDHDGENDVSLFAAIRTPGPVREAIALEKRFDRDWWMRHPQVLEVPLNFAVEVIEEMGVMQSESSLNGRR